MKKDISKSLTIIVTIVLATIILTACKEGKIGMDRSKITNLKAIDKTENKSYAEMLVNEIPEYELCISVLTLPETYEPDYILYTSRSTTTENVNKITSGYTSESTGWSFWIQLNIYSSVKEAQDAWLTFLLEGTSAPEVPAIEVSGIAVGDVGFGFAHMLYFVRGNVYVYVHSNNPNATVDTIAQELDAQILAALEEAAQNQNTTNSMEPTESASSSNAYTDASLASANTILSYQNATENVTYGDEDALSARAELRANQAISISRTVSIDGIAYTFMRREFPLGFSMVVPDSFGELEKERVQTMYPHEDPPSFIIASEDSIVCLAFDTEEPDGDSIEVRLDRYRGFTKRMYPSNAFFSMDTHVLGNGIRAGSYDYLSNALDADLYNLNFFADLPSMELLAWFTCPYDSRPQWEPLVRQMIQTIEPLQLDELERR